MIVQRTRLEPGVKCQPHTRLIMFDLLESNTSPPPPYEAKIRASEPPCPGSVSQQELDDLMVGTVVKTPYQCRV